MNTPSAFFYVIASSRCLKRRYNNKIAWRMTIGEVKSECIVFIVIIAIVVKYENNNHSSNFHGVLTYLHLLNWCLHSFKSWNYTYFLILLFLMHFISINCKSMEYDCEFEAYTLITYEKHENTSAII